MSKICSNCKTELRDEDVVCPVCNTYTGCTTAENNIVFCEGCGARIKPGDRLCPKCGRPAPSILSTQSAAKDLAYGNTSNFRAITDEDLEFAAKRQHLCNLPSPKFDPDATNILTPLGDSVSVKHEAEDSVRFTRSMQEQDELCHKKKKKCTSRLVVLVLLGLLVSCCVYFVTQDPLGVMPGFWEQLQQSAQEVFPQREDNPSSQAGAGLGTPVDENRVLTNEEVFIKLDSIYQRIAGFKDSYGEIITLYNGYYIAYDKDKRLESAGPAYALRDLCDATVEELESLNLPTDCVYLDDIDHLIQLSKWMRGMADTICQSWDISLSFEEGVSLAEHTSEITQPLRDCLDEYGQDQNRLQFNEHILSWAPVEKPL